MLKSSYRALQGLVGLFRNGIKGKDMNRKELWEIFMLFLDMNDCKGSYLYYLRKDGYKVKDVREEFHCRDVLVDTFTWQGTKQGHNFWNSIDDKWMEVVSKLDIAED